MQRGSRVQKLLLNASAKAAAFLVLLVLIFSPFANVLSTPVVHAADNTTQTSTTASGTAGSSTTGSGSTGDNSDNVNCGFFSNIAACIGNVVYVFTVSLGTGVAYIGANIFSVAVKLSLSSTAYGLDFITTGWTKVRDIANMFFIFILIYIAVMIILSADTGHTMQTLAFVIFIALIINFSFFFTRVVIDAGNIVALQFYNAIQAPTMAQAGQSTTAGGLVNAAVSGVSGQLGNTKDLTFSIMNAIQVQNILSTPSFVNFYRSKDFFSDLIALSFTYICVGAILFILAAAFLTAGVKFLLRMVVLWFMIIVSPLALIAKTMHQFEKYYNDWQDALIKHAFYPVVFLFIFWMLTQMVGALGGGGGSIIANTFGDVNQLCSNQSTSALACIGTIVAVIGIRLGFVIVMLYIGFKAADEIGVMGANAAHAVSNKIAFGSVGFLGRRTVGRVAYGVSRNKTLRKLSAANPSVMGRLWSGADKLGKSSFDLRAPLAKVGVDDYGKPAGKGGIAKRIDDKAKAYEKRAKAMKGDAVDEAKEQRKFEKEYDKENGSGEYSKRVGELKGKIKEARREAVKFAALAQKSTGNLAESYNESAKVQNTLAKNIEKNELKPLQEIGKKVVSLQDKELMEKYAKRLSNRFSRAQLLGAAKVIKLAEGKTAHEKLTDAAKEVAKEHDEEEGHDQEEGGNNHAQTSGSGSNTGNTGHTPPSGGPANPHHG